jgi:hypothetical protein
MDNKNKNNSVLINKKIIVLIVAAVLIIYGSTIIGLVFGYHATIYTNYKFETVIDKSEINNSKPTSLITNEVTTAIPYILPNKSIDYRLPKHLSPYYYDLYVSTNLNDEIKMNNYNGTVKIYFECINLTNKIIFHARSLKILNETIEVLELNGKKLEISKVAYEINTEFFIIELNNSLQINKNYSVFLNYYGNLKQDMAGFFRSSYIDSNGEKRYFQIISELFSILN